jgi:hypothetical protein
VFYLKNSLTPGNADVSVQYGAANAGWLPVAGDWDGDGKDNVGLYDPHNSEFHLKANNSLEFVFLAKSLSSFTKDHSNWFKKDANGNVARNVFGLDAWDYNNNQFRSWWTNMIVSEWILKFDLDGLRLDLEPNISNFSGVWTDVRQRAAQSGKDIVLFSEGRDGDGNSGDNRHKEYDFTEWGFGVDPVWGGINFLDSNYNIVDTIKGGKFSDRYYTSTLSYTNTGGADSHGEKGPHYNARGNLAYFAYGLLLSPFVPVWYMGEEFNNECLMPNGLNGLKACRNYISADPFDRLYFVGMQWNSMKNNAAFLEKVKKIIQIRKENIDIISPQNSSLSQIPIIKIGYSGTDLAPYALHNGMNAIVVVAKKNGTSGEVALNISLSEMNLDGGNSYSITNLMDGACKQVSQNILADYKININTGDAAILKIVKNGHCSNICNPKNCADLGYVCGLWSDECANTVNCGACTTPKTCSDGQCVLDCASKSYKQCDGDNLYWYNSCSNKEELIQNCQTEGKICENNACVGLFVLGPGKEQLEQMTRDEIVAKIAEIKQLLIKLIIQLTAKLQEHLAEMR